MSLQDSYYLAQNPQVMLFADGYIERIIYNAEEADSQTFRSGQFIYVDGGSVKEAATNTPIHGIALKSGTNASGGNQEIPFIRLTPGDVIRIRLRNGGTLIGNDVPIIYGNYGISVVDNICFLDIAEQTDVRLRYLGPLMIGENVEGGNWGRAQVLSAAIEPPAGG